MPSKLSIPEIAANIDMPQLAVTSKGGPEIPAFIEFETREQTAAVSKVGTGSPWVELGLPGRLAFRELASENQTWSSRTRENGKSKVIAIPKLESPAGQDPVLTDTVRRVLRTLYAIVVSRALQVNFPLRRTIVSVFEDPTEQERKALLRLTCNSNAVQALAFWDSLEPDLQSWLNTSSEKDRTTFITKIGLRVHWR